VLNLVFFKLVRSKTKFWQMVGRGTRLCLDVFAPGKHKEFFYLFDYCQNLEFFSQNPEATDGSLGESLGKRLFTARLELIGELDHLTTASTRDGRVGEASLEEGLRTAVAAHLCAEVAAMNVDNFIVRPRRRLVEKYSQPEAWWKLTAESFEELAHDVAGLPAAQEPEDEEAKRFDLLMLNLQLAVLRADHGFERLRDQVKSIAGLLEEKASIPMVQQQLSIIQNLQTYEWWRDVTTPMLETVRKRLRALVKLIDKQARKPIYTDFEDLMGGETSFELPGFAAPDGFERFRAKAQAFLKSHENHLTIHKLRMNRPLTSSDLDELEKMLTASGIGGHDHLQRARMRAKDSGCSFVL
jgi:type I restriction enzyme, R subunit